MVRGCKLPVIVLSACVLPFISAAQAAPDSDLATQIRELRDQINAQQKMIADQQEKLRRLERQVLNQQPGPKVQNLDVFRGAGAPNQATPQSMAQQPGQQQQAPVGAPPPEKERPEIAAISDVGGVLTPQGVLTIEPSFEYDSSQVNRFFFAGTEIVNAVFIGGLEAANQRRNTLIAALNARYGITNRIQVDTKVPYVYRSDRVASGLTNTDTLDTSVYGHDIGDVEFGAHYQVNQPTEGGAYYVANLRVKSDTGTGPFDVPFNSVGVQTSRLPTGSGDWAIEPSLTVLYPNDPVVLFGTLGYAYFTPFNPNRFVPGTGTVTNVEPGGTLRGIFGFGFAFNDRTSMSLGYEHDWVMSTTSKVNGAKTHSEELQIGSFNAGLSYAFSPKISANATVSVGATRDAPDVRLLFSVPISFDIFR